ncbi:putative 2-hydroxypent-2,4-dienoate hydratase [Pseudomonas sp. ATCC 13867]|uniref:2-keto-4-pentenoate hydratase n=1 Tax=Pseudomonas sp. ATCC 13867 TaxID=1294143 RepID=UPI0002C4E39B|nr:fumarylacetoacetate hydrolase family protein [Pseudomonas sp. ATCC 13867]AGI23560.1 putative 2-hydroxypent-2,4-dienoate hydratase [Pseudomonas sp. ATCC 13867]RFQ25098.1 2-keto-4-pentenoate hydratase [Pseudomonas sp. ATCC 13867]
MSTDNHHAAARALAHARASRTPLAAPAATYVLSGLDDAYRVQALGIDLALAAGEHLAGAKAGLISPVMQAALKVDEPVYGRLLASLRCQPGARIPRDRLLQPRIEAEIALLVGRDLPASEPDLADLSACIDGAVPAIEINDSAVANWQIGLLDSIADNLCAGLYLTGGQPVALKTLEGTALAVQLLRNGAPAFPPTQTNITAVLDIALWLARRMARLGAPLKAGDVLLCGALAPMSQVTPGDDFELEIEGLGRIGCSFEG